MTRVTMCATREHSDNMHYLSHSKDIYHSAMLLNYVRLCHICSTFATLHRCCIGVKKDLVRHRIDFANQCCQENLRVTQVREGNVLY
jgi:hypothetical protein